MKLLALVLLVAGCASTEVSEVRLNERAWEIDGAGNGYTSPTEAREQILRRAAELTLASGYALFYIEGESGDVDQRVGRINGQLVVVNRPEARITITMVTKREQNQMPGRLVYDARLVLRELGG
jgi:hypothetical protein